MKILFTAVCLLIVNVALAQNTRIELSFNSASWSGYWGDRYGPRAFFYKNSYNSINQLHAGCFQFPSSSNGSTLVVRSLYSVYIQPNTHEFTIILRSFEKRKGNSDDCYYNDSSGGKPDRFESFSTNILDLNKYPPGVWFGYSMTTNPSGSPQFTSNLSVRYTPFVYKIPQTNPGNLCSNEQFNVISVNPFGNAGDTTGLQFDWEYHVKGESIPNPDFTLCNNTCYSNLYQCSNGSACYSDFSQCMNSCSSNYPAEIDHWVTFKTTNTRILNFNPLSEIFSNVLVTNKEVQFRVKTRGPQLSSVFSAESEFYSFTPPPPFSSDEVLISKSCTESATGTITLNNISSVYSTYRYILKRGDVDSLGCDPEKTGCLVDVETSGPNSGSTLRLTNIPVGIYSLFLLNDAANLGVCPRRIGNAIIIDAVTQLDLKPLTLSNLACNGLNQGIAAVTIINGKPDAVLYNLQNKTTSQSYSLNSNVSDATVTFSALSPGSHTLTVNDGCTDVVTKTFVITQPAKVDTTEFQFVASTCTDPGNGVAKINVTRSSDAFTQSLSGLYSYQIIKNGSSYFDIEVADDNYTWTTLPPSTDYKVVVKEKGGSVCNAAIVNFIIDGNDRISLKNQTLKNVSCFGGSDGEIQVEGEGGTKNFNYELSGAGSFSSTTGIFKNLKRGDYILTIKNTIACNDKYVSAPIPISQPAQVEPTITKTDISCFGLTDGKINSLVTGGTTTPSGYSYTWETNINNTWTALSITTSSLSGLSDGTFRLNVKDKNYCVGISNEVTIIEPTKLLIDNVAVHDIACLNEKGTIALTPSGGTNPYSYEYAVNNGVFQNFTSSTQLDAANYKVAVKDSNGCRNEDSNTYVISSPPSALSFTSVLSDYNGFNISCFDGSNGYVTFTATGGNGASYSGYEYAIDASVFKDITKIENISAGTHALHVKDARGCVVSESKLFTQTDEKLIAQLTEKMDVVCFGDETGVLEIKGGGGLSPYQYSIDNSPNQNTGRFTKLGVGTYDFKVTDKNNCSTVFLQDIESLNQVIEIESTVKDVNCFGGADGMITTFASGGVPPFQYQWLGQTSTTSVLSGLKKGDYSLKIIDNAGCKMESLISVSQPEHELKINLLVLPVCFGKTDGSISVTTSGGTSPYQYSIDNGLHYQSSFLFSAVGTGNYNIIAKDNNECITTQQAEVIQRNDKPEPNFLAATKRNALDTLVITEISVPKPDSVFWIFDPMPEVLDNNMWSPLIKYNEPGTYSITLTGFFGGCDYTVTKSLYVNPFDPNAIPDKTPGYRPIESVVVTPNPSTGEFEVTVKLNKKRNVSMLVYDMIGSSQFSNTWQEVESVKQKITLDKVASGIYLLRVITETDAQDVRIIINK